MTAMVPYRWPDGKRCAAVLSFDFDGETPYLWNNRNQPSKALGELEQRRFGPRQGIHRILDLLAEQNLRATFYIPGAIAERYPEAVTRIAAEGHEIGLHGYLHERVDQITKGEIEETTARAMEALQRVSRQTPVGYRSPSWEMTPETLTVIESIGLSYDSSLMGYDHPYWVGNLVEVPVQWLLDDAPYYRYVGRGDTRPPAYPTDVISSWRLELEGAKRFGGLFMLTMHPWISGRASRLLALEKLVADYRHDPEIEWATAAEVAAFHRRAHFSEFRESPQPMRVR